MSAITYCLRQYSVRVRCNYIRDVKDLADDRWKATDIRDQRREGREHRCRLHVISHPDAT